jgi:hypothetical protein
MKKSQVEIDRLNELKEDADLKCKQLVKQMLEINDEKQSLLNELDQLKTQLSEREAAHARSKNE